MRVIRGILKSRRFSIPKNFPSRPTTDFAKEGLFNILENQIDFVDLEILDLCAGTGNITFEFLSREAGKVTAIDKDYNSVRFISKTAKDFGVNQPLQALKMDVIAFLEKTEKQYDLIFADPPYAAKFHKQIVDIVSERKLLKPDGILIIEHGKDVSFDDNPSLIKFKNYGGVCFSFIENNN